MTTTLVGASVNELFCHAVQAVAADGRQVSPRGQATRELLDARLRLTRPRARLVHLPPARVLNPAFAAAETVWIMSGTDAPWIFDYNERLRKYADDGVLRGAYGPRIRSWGGYVDQLQRVLTTLKDDPDSRRAVVQLYDPIRDAEGHRDVPCTLGYRFHIRDGRLHMSTTMRAQDVWIGLPYDLFAATVLHELMAGWLGVELGDYHHHVDSLHIYERDLDNAAALPATVPAEVEMAPLSVSWEELDDLLVRVAKGEMVTHAGWDAIALTMCSYRLWKGGDIATAVRVAADVGGPLGEALDTWYQRLAERRCSTAVMTTSTENR